MYTTQDLRDCQALVSGRISLEDEGGSVGRGWTREAMGSVAALCGKGVDAAGLEPCLGVVVTEHG